VNVEAASDRYIRFAGRLLGCFGCYTDACSSNMRCFGRRIMIMASPCLGGPSLTLPIKAVKAGCSDHLLLLLLESTDFISFHVLGRETPAVRIVSYWYEHFDNVHPAKAVEDMLKTKASLRSGTAQQARQRLW